MLARVILGFASCWLAGAIPIFTGEESTQKERRYENRDALHQETHPHHELRPRHHPSHDATDHVHLLPRSEKSLFWGQHRSQNYIMSDDRWLAAQTTFKHPTVVLDHSSHIKASLSGDLITVIFLGKEAFQASSESWTGTELPFLLVTTEGSTDGHFQYFTTTYVECSDVTSTCLLNITSAEFENVVDGFELNFGHYDELDRRSEAQWTPDAVDAHLDSQLGYYSFADEDFAASLSQFAEGLNDTNPAHYAVNTLDGTGGIFNKDGTVSASVILEPSDEDFFEELGSKKRGLQRRIFSTVGNTITGAATTVGNTVSSGAQTVGNGVNNAVTPVRDAVFDGVQNVQQYTNGNPQVFNGGGSFNIPSQGVSKAVAFAQTVFRDTSGPFSPALIIWQTQKNGKMIRISCLGCRLQGTVRLRGTIAYRLGSGLQTGTINFDGDFTATVRIGLEAGASWGQEVSKRLFELGIPGFSVPNFITVGPMLTLDAKAGINLGVAGNVMAGAVVSIAFSQDINLLSARNTARPHFRRRTLTPSFEASAEAVAEFSFSLPIGVALGISIGNNKLSATAAVISEPGVRATAAAGVTLNSAGISTNNNGCNGLRLSFALVHSLFAEGVARLTVASYNTPRYLLAEDIRHEIAQRCFPRRAGKRSDNGNTPGEIVFFDLDEVADDLSVGPNVNTTEVFSTGFNDAPYHMPAAVAQYVSDKGPPNFASNPSTSLTNEEGTLFNYTIISDTTWDYNLVATPNGGLSLESSNNTVTANDLFAVYKNVVIGDSLGRLLVYFGGEMEKYGVSRIRMEPPDRIPKTSRAVGLIPVTVPSTGPWPTGVPPAVLVATDSVLRTFLPVLCHYKDGTTPNKMFIVENLEKGIATLLKDDTDLTLTGGPVDKCQYLALNNGLPGLV